MVRRKCPSTIEKESIWIHGVIQVTRSGEWSYGEKYRLKIQTISDLRVHKFYYWSDFCERLDEYGTGALNDLSTDSVDSVDDSDQFKKALNKIHKDLMFKNDVEEFCVEVHIDKTGKESHEMPQKACERCIFHVRPYAFYFEMPQNRRLSFSVHFSFSNKSRVFSLKCPDFLCSNFLKCPIFPIWFWFFCHHHGKHTWSPSPWLSIFFWFIYSETYNYIKLIGGNLIGRIFIKDIANV